MRNWKTNYNKTAGCTQAEIDGYEAQLNPSAESGHKPLKDAWRQLHPDALGYYTYFSARFQCRAKGIGWRLDSFVVSTERDDDDWPKLISRLSLAFGALDGEGEAVRN